MAGLLGYLVMAELWSTSSIQFADVCVAMCGGRCVGMRAGICVGMCADMCVDMCLDMCVDMCLDMCVASSR